MIVLRFHFIHNLVVSINANLFSIHNLVFDGCIVYFGNLNGYHIFVSLKWVLLWFFIVWFLDMFGFISVSQAKWFVYSTFILHINLRCTALVLSGKIHSIRLLSECQSEGFMINFGSLLGFLVCTKAISQWFIEHSL